MNVRKVKISLQAEELNIALEYTIGPIEGQREFLRLCRVSGLNKPSTPKQLALIFANRNQILLFEAHLQFYDLVSAIKVLVELEATTDHRLMMEYLNRLNYAKQQYTASAKNNCLVAYLSFFGCGTGFAKPNFTVEEVSAAENESSYSL